MAMEEEVMAVVAPETATPGDQNQTLVVKTTAAAAAAEAAADLVSEATTMAQTTAMAT